MQLAADEARRLKRSFALPEDIVLAILNGEPCTAQEVLKSVGVEAEDFERELVNILRETRTPQDPPDNIDSPDHVAATPALGQCLGRAQGLGVGLGTKDVAEQWLMAVLWDTFYLLPDILSRLGTSRDAIWERLAATGIKFPRGRLPPRLGE